MTHLSNTRKVARRKGKLDRIMKLIIVESPKKCDTIGHYLGDDYKVMASQGHIRDLSTKGKGGLGIDIENDFMPDFVVPSGRERIVNELKTAAKKADEVILATDPDREGEAISWHLAKVLGLDIDTTKRLQFHEITKPAITEALSNPSTIDMNLVHSQETRRMYDRIIGFKLSALLKNRIGSKSAGRVQSATLKMIVDNDSEIKAFVPEEYWDIKVELRAGKRKLALTLDKIDGKAKDIKTEAEAQKILERLGDSLVLTNLSTSKKSVPSKPAFTTSTMQQEAYTRYHFSTSKTQGLAQKLYEGLTVNGEHVGLITYMRTDSTRLSPIFFNGQAKPFIEERFGGEYVGHSKEGKKQANAQDAHEAIRPTSVKRTPEIVAQYVTSDEAKLYRLIYERALASCMSDHLEEITTATFESNGLSFKISGSRTLFPGYWALFKDEEEDKELPALEEGKAYSLSFKDKEQKFTKAPARFTEAKIVKLMEEKGIGRPSTYASTLHTLQQRGYIVSKTGVVTPTESGIKTTFVMNKYFPEIVSVKYTAGMEKTLDEISEGSLDRLDAMNNFYGPFIDQFNEVSERMYKDPDEQTGDLCPVCGSPLVIKKGRFGQFVACSNYPSCSYVEKKAKEGPKEVGRNCPVCGKPLVERKDKKGKVFVACSGYPSCTYIEGQEEKKVTYTESDYIKECPQCKTGHIVLKHGKKVDFYGCTNYPKCQYHEWLEKKKK